MNKVLKILTLFSFLIVIIPGEKLSFPVGIAIILPFLGITPALGVLLVMLPWTALVCLTVTMFHRKPTVEDAFITLVCMSVFWVFLLIYIRNFLAYSSYDTYLTLGAFIILSAACFIYNLKLFLRLREQKTNP